ncbi:hypothetical protein SAMN02745148_02175 [Modicisalibacter ilicicola DSM 19980]|uniref:Uncharacterized protein n=1 Tax=Modicisalibacter ilicicola DSM 19980 TaxID=1121942 RepID=A0A1M5A3T7_9GAMM|nr:hypothetical protein [Halomonas ilicicola]SHF24980.1 hypothetical protein SAMN02745148_02175 [Halomonas ilicicola DSM 19980]
MAGTLYVYLLGGMFALIFSNIAVWLYVAFFKLSQVEKHLSNCQLVENNRRIWGGGPFGRMYRLMQISSMLLFPKPIVKNGEADLEDIQNLPISLRRWVRIPFNVGLALSIYHVRAMGLGQICWLA